MKLYKSLGFRLSLLLALGFVLAPLLAILPLAFSNNEYLKVQGFTFRWITTVLTDPLWREAIQNSFFVAFSSALVSVLIAVPTSELLRKKSEKFQTISYTLAVIPVAMPAIIVALSLLKWFYIINIVDTLGGLIAAHCLMSLPVVLLLVNNYTIRFFRNHPNIEGAAALMGLTGGRFFRLVTFPNIVSPILGSFILAFAISFNEGVIVQMLASEHTMMISKKLFDGLKFEINPTIAAVSCLLMIFSIISYSLLNSVFKKTVWHG